MIENVLSSNVNESVTDCELMVKEKIMPRFVIEESASRDDVFLKTAIMGPSGSGKTYSSLVVATGMAKEFEKKHGRPAKIALADTEKGRGKYYLGEFKYSYIRFDAPYNPESYIELINYCVDKGYDILIIDSTSHEWDGEGGCLELQQKAGGTYQAWSRVSPRHNKFIESIAYSPIHIIATMRGKDQYEVEKDEKGKTTVKKLGMGARQRDGFEYDFTCSLMLDQKTHTVDVEKDTTHCFDNKAAFILTEEDGEQLMKWATSGSGKMPETRRIEPENVSSDDTLMAIKKEIASTCNDLVKTKKITAAKLKTFLKEQAGVDMPNLIEDLSVAQKCLDMLKEM